MYATATAFDAAHNATGPMTLEEFTDIFNEMQEQPGWRARADREMDYVDGNQLDSEVLRKQQELGIPPAIEPLIGPAIDAVCGLELKNRADWRVEPDNQTTGDEVAKAMGYKLNQAERKSKADQACSEAYRTQISVGLGWVEVARESNPFKFPYRVRSIHRNEIWWDMLSVEPDLSDCRWLLRRKWTDARQVRLLFKNKVTLIENAMRGWNSMMETGQIDGGTTTDLNTSFYNERGWSVEEQQWRLQGGKRVCLFEVWYRRWVRVLIIRTPDGRVVELNKENPVHLEAVAAGLTQPEWVVVPRMRMSIWMGPHCLKDEPSPYRHNKFPYVPFWGKREDRTGTPYGLVKGMMFLQDNVNATLSKIRWGLSAIRSVRTKGATKMTDAQFRRMSARPDADFVLDAEHMAKPGAKFEFSRDFQLNDQQFQMLTDGRDGINRVANISPTMQGSTGTAKSGYQQAQQTENSTQALADINEGFNVGRAEVGELLLSMITEDLIGKQETVLVPGMGLREDMPVLLNQPKADEATGMQYMDNDIERAMLKVGINDVPSTSSYRAQQLVAMSEAFKSMPPEFQRVTMPYLVALMDLPTDTREEIIKTVRETAKSPTSEQIEKMIAEAVKDARTQDARDLKVHELSMKYTPDLMDAQIRKILADTFKTNVDAFYASNQTAATIAANPAIASVADIIAMLAGYTPPNPRGVDPNMPVPAQAAAPAGTLPAPGGADPQAGGAPNTNPTLPPPMPKAPTPTTGPAGPGEGIETQRFSDNVPA